MNDTIASILDPYPLMTDLETLRFFMERGWHQGSWVNGSCTCLGYGIIATAGMVQTKRPEDQRVEYARFIRLVKVLGFNLMGQVIAWNDTPGRTQQEVLALIDETIEREKQ